MKKYGIYIFALVGAFALQSCKDKNPEKKEAKKTDTTSVTAIQKKLDQYATVELSTDISKLTESQKKVLGLLIEASKPMTTIFWRETYGDKSELMAGIKDPKVRKYATINIGPWDRLNGNEAFVEGVGTKPLGANFYPQDMTKAEFEAWDNDKKDDLYTVIRRDSLGNLKAIPYHIAFAEQHEIAAKKLKKAAEITENEGLANYLNLRAEALLTGNYKASDIAWLEMQDNKIGLILGPVETYEDKLFGYKAAHEALVLVKDKDWSQRLSKYVEVLPALQKGLPVPEKYKQELPGNNSDLNVYDVVFYAGSANMGGKTIAVNLPNDPKIRTNVGTRRLQLKNVMRAKYQEILVPIAELLIVPQQQKYISFDAFFANTMFHEVAHGLGVGHVLGTDQSVREALKENYSALEEGKADVLGLYMIDELREKGMIKEGSIKNNYVTFVASIFRSIRFGAHEAHGLANLIRFNFYLEKGAISFNKEAKTWKVNFDKIDDASRALSKKILIFQGDGDYKGVEAFVEKYGNIGSKLKESLQKVKEADIPVDIIFEQGKEVLGL